MCNNVFELADVISLTILSGVTAGEELTWEGFCQAAVDSFLISSFFAFVSASVDFIKVTARGTPYPQPELVKNSQTNTAHDGVGIQYANKSDFTPEAWGRVESLPKRADGSTISNLRDGLAIHRGYKFGLHGKEYTLPGYGRIDYLDVWNKVIYELKPNNAASIMRGIEQLHRYSIGLGGSYSLILVLY